MRWQRTSCSLALSHLSLQWRHNGCDSVSNHHPHDCFLIRLFRHRSKKTSKLRVTGLCVGNSAKTGEFPTQMASNAENVSIWWRHHDMLGCISFAVQRHQTPLRPDPVCKEYCFVSHFFLNLTWYYIMDTYVSRSHPGVSHVLIYIPCCTLSFATS